MKSGNTQGVDGFQVECLKKGGMAVLEWLVKLFDMQVVPMDWRGTCIVPLGNKFYICEGKGDKCECSNSRGIICFFNSWTIKNRNCNYSLWEG